LYWCWLLMLKENPQLKSVERSFVVSGNVGECWAPVNRFVFLWMSCLWPTNYIWIIFELVSLLNNMCLHGDDRRVRWSNSLFPYFLSSPLIPSQKLASYRESFSTCIGLSLLLVECVNLYTVLRDTENICTNSGIDFPNHQFINWVLSKVNLFPGILLNLIIRFKHVWSAKFHKQSQQISIEAF